VLSDISAQGNPGAYTGLHAGMRCQLQAPAQIQNQLLNSEVEAMKFRPLHDRVVVRRIEEDTKTAGGIIIPDTAKEKPMQGEVIAAGPGARDDSGRIVPLDVKRGDRVLFGKWSGTEVKIDGDDLLIMKESDILGVIEGKASVRAAA
jgi:chaperonin GroES